MMSLSSGRKKCYQRRSFCILSFWSEPVTSIVIHSVSLALWTRSFVVSPGRGRVPDRDVGSIRQLVQFGHCAKPIPELTITVELVGIASWVEPRPRLAKRQRGAPSRLSPHVDDLYAKVGSDPHCTSMGVTCPRWWSPGDALVAQVRR